MSTHALPATGDTTTRWEQAIRLRKLARGYFDSEPTIEGDTGTLSLTFTPDLTAGEQATLSRLIATTGLMRVTPTEWAGIEADIDGLRQYVNLTTPTLVQTANAVKAITRFLRVLIRD